MRRSPSRTTRSNEARALKLLASKGLITLKDGAGNTRRPPRTSRRTRRRPQVQGAGGGSDPRSLDDVDAAVINGNYAISSGLKPAKDALFLESATNNPYGNFLAVKKGNEAIRG